MNKFKKNQSGFGAVELILIVVVIGLLGAVGYLVYKNQKKPATVTVTKTVTAPAQTTSPAAATTAKPDPKEYLVIKEWGIKVKIDEADKLTYTIVPQANTGTTVDGGGTYVDAARLSLADNITTDVSCKAIGIGIGRAKETGSPSQLPKVGDYLFEVGGSPYSCGNATLDSIRANYTGNHPSTWVYSTSN